jgi:hypothetical protein
MTLRRIAPLFLFFFLKFQYLFATCFIFFIDLLPDILEQRPKESDSLDTVIIVDNVPVVGPDRLDKLKSIIRKVFSKFGNVVNEFYPEQDGKTKGLVYILKHLCFWSFSVCFQNMTNL